MLARGKKVLLAVIAVLLVVLISAQISMAAGTTVNITLPALNAGSSVVGLGMIAPDLNIHTSGGNDVQLIRSGQSPVVFGGGWDNIANDCLKNGWGIADTGGATGQRYHEYSFSFTEGKTVSDFQVSLADWGDFLPNAYVPSIHLEIRLTAYNSANQIVDEDIMLNDLINGRSVQFGNMREGGDSCNSRIGQPGQYTFHVTGSGITRVELRFIGPQSIDPNMALQEPFGYTLETLPPYAEDDSTATQLHTPVSLDVVSNDTDPDNQLLTISNFDTTSVFGGTVSCDGALCSYTPGFAYTGTDTFGYIICDESHLCDTALVSVNVTNPVGTFGCTKTQGYWKTHSDIANDKFDATWSLLPSGRDTVFFLSGQTYYQVMEASTKGSPYYSLAQQYIAAEMNMRSGASIPDGTLTAFQTARDLFGTYTPAQLADKNNKALQAQFTALIGVLDQYNNGKTGPSHCG